MVQMRRRIVRESGSEGSTDHIAAREHRQPTFPFVQNYNNFTKAILESRIISTVNTKA